MEMTCVMDDLSSGRPFEHEHGLSILVRTERHTVLFDTGASPRLIQNMVSLGIEPESIDSIVVSHGHNDHSGGLQSFTKMNRRARIFVGRGFTRLRYHHSSSGLEEIGYPGRDRIADISDRIEEVTNVREIDDGLFVLPAVALKNRDKLHNDGLLVAENDHTTPDTFDDEIYLAVRTASGLCVVSGCSHRGIENIIDGVNEALPDSRIGCIAGGLHLLHEPDASFPSVVEMIRSHNIPLVAANHCTGNAATKHLSESLGSGFTYFEIGDTIRL